MSIRAFGIDPGTKATGWGVIERNGTTWTRLSSGVLKPRQELSVGERLFIMHHELRERVIEFNPKIVGIEDQFVGKNPRPSIIIGMARGVAMAAAAYVETLVLPPSTVKKAVAGNGRADKEQVARMVETMLGYRAEKDDESDALALAITASMQLGVLRGKVSL